MEQFPREILLIITSYISEHLDLIRFLNVFSFTNMEYYNILIMKHSIVISNAIKSKITSRIYELDFHELYMKLLNGKYYSYSNDSHDFYKVFDDGTSPDPLLNFLFDIDRFDFVDYAGIRWLYRTKNKWIDSFKKTKAISD